MFTILSRDFGAWTNGIKTSFVRDGSTHSVLKSPTAVAYTPATFIVTNPSSNQSYSHRIRCGITI